MSLSVIMKCTAAIRQLAYGTTPDAFDEYLQMSKHTACDCLFYFSMCIISLYMAEYLRKPTLEDIENIYSKHVTRHGFSGMLGSIDCANNDINVLDNSLLFDDLLDEKSPVAPYVVNGVGFEKGYYLADASAFQVLKRLGSIFTLVYTVVQKLKKDSCVYSGTEAEEGLLIPKDQQVVSEPSGL
nr:reverse transcriptase domain-containing protein [Tanacetum cinerariifolium]